MQRDFRNLSFWHAYIWFTIFLFSFASFLHNIYMATLMVLDIVVWWNVELSQLRAYTLVKMRTLISEWSTNTCGWVPFIVIFLCTLSQLQHCCLCTLQDTSHIVCWYFETLNANFLHRCDNILPFDFVAFVLEVGSQWFSKLDIYDVAPEAMSQITE